jgi:hypothetical protein
MARPESREPPPSAPSWARGPSEGAGGAHGRPLAEALEGQPGAGPSAVPAPPPPSAAGRRAVEPIGREVYGGTHGPGHRGPHGRRHGHNPKARRSAGGAGHGGGRARQGASGLAVAGRTLAAAATATARFAAALVLGTLLMSLLLLVGVFPF